MQSNDHKTLSEVVGIYVSSIKSQDTRDVIQKELVRFSQWCGADRPFAKINPAEIGDYSERLGGSAARPHAAEHLKAVKGLLSYARKRGLTERRLAQHVRVHRSKVADNLLKGRPSQEAEQLTPKGHAALVTELEQLRADRAPLAQQIRSAAADKDVRENAPLEAAREQLGQVESRIVSIESTLKSAVIIGPSTRKAAPTVKIGVRVLVRDLKGGREVAYRLVSRSEANPLEGRISDGSPLGQALLGSAVGQEVEAKTPRGQIRYRILKVTS